jgi:DNA-binding response OmpR family regulator
VSGQSTDKDKKRCLDAGADGYYVKPFSIRALDDLIELHFKK